MFTLPDLPYSFDALEPYIDAQTMQIHHDKHHAAYVKNLNELLAGSDLINLSIDHLIIQLDKVPEDIRQKVINNAGGHYNHSLFWKMLSPLSKSQTPNQKILNNAGGHVNHSFFWKILGSSGTPNPKILELKEEFNKKALSIFGSGWVWIIMINDQLSIINTANQDVPKGKIVLGLDVWEHAYYLKYQNRRAEYIEAFWNIINWDEVEKNLI